NLLVHTVQDTVNSSSKSLHWKTAVSRDKTRSEPPIHQRPSYLTLRFPHQKMAGDRGHVIKKIMAVHPATNGRRLAEPLVPAACSSRPLAEASPRRLLAAAGRRHRSLRPRHAPPPLEPQRPSSDCRGNGDGKRGRPATAARGRTEVDAARAQRRA